MSQTECPEVKKPYQSPQNSPSAEGEEQVAGDEWRRGKNPSRNPPPQRRKHGSGKTLELESQKVHLILVKADWVGGLSLLDPIITVTTRGH